MSTSTVDPIICGRVTRSLDRTELFAVNGQRLADIGVVPQLLAQTALHELRAAADGIPPDPAILVRAAELFCSGEPGGETVAEYQHNTARATGLAIATVRRAARDIMAEVKSLPDATVADLPPSALASGVRIHWVAAGRVFAAVMASNHPAPNASWIQALYHGYSVVVRPGGRDPFTARRLVFSLLEAGLPPHRIAFLPCDHRVGEYLLSQADRGIVYGGDDAVRRWQHSRQVTTRGPGRTKALLDRKCTADIVDHLTLSAAFDGGTRCNNLSTILTSQSPGEVADALAAQLAEVPVAAPSDTIAILPAIDAGRVDGFLRQLDGLRTGLTDHSAALNAGDAFVKLDDGSFLARPLVMSTTDPHHPAVGLELPFPFVVVAPWESSSGAAPLRNSLVANLLTKQETVVEQALREPTIRKVTLGKVLPWSARPGVPHEGNFTQFLLEPKGVVTIAMLRPGDLRCVG
ncbi:aldehyde dehydrogenase [Rhizocola hellebori]|uniref:Aldehyde dehydrogenase n=1 Tax=Rhizocola hellebori TaxID=1392758 RepID=A0A8J3Q708_9ACTN|nr:aldehyde dehydrogenase family protein [Rhizocola hellebori]GIH05144.1 aldehyde dehydrogenase [Rhizocola hellebori]